MDGKWGWRWDLRQRQGEREKKFLWVEIIGLSSPRKASSGGGAGGNSDCGTEGLLGSLIMI